MEISRHIRPTQVNNSSHGNVELMIVVSPKRTILPETLQKLLENMEKIQRH